MAHTNTGHALEIRLPNGRRCSKWRYRINWIAMIATFCATIVTFGCDEQGEPTLVQITGDLPVGDPQTDEFMFFGALIAETVIMTTVTDDDPETGEEGPWVEGIPLDETTMRAQYPNYYALITAYAEMKPNLTYIPRFEAQALSVIERVANQIEQSETFDGTVDLGTAANELLLILLNEFAPDFLEIMNNVAENVIPNVDFEAFQDGVNFPPTTPEDWFNYLKNGAGLIQDSLSAIAGAGAQATKDAICLAYEVGQLPDSGESALSGVMSGPYNFLANEQIASIPMLGSQTVISEEDAEDFRARCESIRAPLQLFREFRMVIGRALEINQGAEFRGGDGTVPSFAALGLSAPGKWGGPSSGGDSVPQPNEITLAAIFCIVLKLFLLYLAYHAVRWALDQFLLWACGRTLNDIIAGALGDANRSCGGALDFSRGPLSFDLTQLCTCFIYLTNCPSPDFSGAAEGLRAWKNR